MPSTIERQSTSQQTVELACVQATMWHQQCMEPRRIPNGLPEPSGDCQANYSRWAFKWQIPTTAGHNSTSQSSDNMLSERILKTMLFLLSVLLFIDFSALSSQDVAASRPSQLASLIQSPRHGPSRVSRVNRCQRTQIYMNMALTASNKPRCRVRVATNQCYGKCTSYTTPRGSATAGRPRQIWYTIPSRTCSCCRAMATKIVRLVYYCNPMTRKATKIADNLLKQFTAEHGTGDIYTVFVREPQYCQCRPVICL